MAKNVIQGLREQYKELFDLSPALSIEISERKIEGYFVYDTEWIKGLRGSPDTITARVRYKLDASKIVEVVIFR